MSRLSWTPATQPRWRRRMRCCAATSTPPYRTRWATPPGASYCRARLRWPETRLPAVAMRHRPRKPTITACSPITSCVRCVVRQTPTTPGGSTSTSWRTTPNARSGRRRKARRAASARVLFRRKRLLRRPGTWHQALSRNQGAGIKDGQANIASASKLHSYRPNAAISRVRSVRSSRSRCNCSARKAVPRMRPAVSVGSSRIRPSRRAVSIAAM